MGNAGTCAILSILVEAERGGRGGDDDNDNEKGGTWPV